MTKAEKIPATDDAWESGKLGRDAQFVRRSEGVDELVIDESLELQLISIRLPKALIDDFKLIARLNNLGYQPLMRQVLKRFADAEKRQIMRDYYDQVMEQRKKETAAGNDNKSKAA